MKTKEKFMQAVFFVSALMSVLAVALICLFLFANGLPATQKIGLLILSRVKSGDRSTTSTVFCP
jgi:ABC-type phosphate transport system permease subunit